MPIRYGGLRVVIAGLHGVTCKIVDLAAKVRSAFSNSSTNGVVGRQYIGGYPQFLLENKAMFNRDLAHSSIKRLSVAPQHP